LSSLSDLSSVELVRQCAGSKDSAPWTEFVRRFQPVIASAVLRTARRWGEPPRHLLDDLVQDTYLKLCEDNSKMLKSFHPRHEDSIYGYLRVVASNIVHDHFKLMMARKRGAGQTDTIDENIQIDPKASLTDTEAEIFRNLQLEEIDRILGSKLNGRDAKRNSTIFWLRYRQGLTAGEIAAIPAFGLTTEGVESVLQRLLHMIRSHIRNNGHS
jgi:RNA polymerase sigma-70 factor, ECF subfamily